MKSVIYGGVIIATISLMFFGCDKGHNQFSTEHATVIQMKPSISKVDIQSVIDDLNSETKAPKWWTKMKKWFKNHAGTHLFENCQGSGNCGPCPGFCISFDSFGGEENNGDTVSQKDYEDGFRVFGLKLIQHSETGEEAIIFIFNDDLNCFTSDNFLYIERDLNAHMNINLAMSTDSIKFRKGKYHVVLDSITGYHYAMVDALIN